MTDEKAGKTPRHPLVKEWLDGDMDAGGTIAKLELEIERLRYGIELIANSVALVLLSKSVPQKMIAGMREIEANLRALLAARKAKS